MRGENPPAVRGVDYCYTYVLISTPSSYHPSTHICGHCHVSVYIIDSSSVYLLNPRTPTMASKSAVLPLLRRELAPSSPRLTRAASSWTLSAIRRPGSSGSSPASRTRDARLAALHRQTTRLFSQSSIRSLATENDNFDPRQVDRESDEVDVCIVGGGKLHAV